MKDRELEKYMERRVGRAQWSGTLRVRRDLGANLPMRRKSARWPTFRPLMPHPPRRPAVLLKPAGSNQHGGGAPLVIFGQDVEVKEGETKEAVVVIGGSAKVRGKVNDAVVIIGGKAEISGEVGDAVVTVFGGVKLTPSARIHGDAVAVGGNLEVQDGASVDGDAVSVLGKLDVAKTDAVKGQIVNVIAGALPNLEPLKKFFLECVLKFRPLAPSVGWVWAVAGAFLLLYLLVALAFPRPVQNCVDELTRRPATTFLIGLLTKLIIPILTLVLILTGVGIFIVPFLSAAVLFAGIVGKAALLQYFGQQLGKQFSHGTTLKPLVALLIGAALLTVLYMVPVLGLLALLTTGLWALGAAVMALFGGMRREMPERRVASCISAASQLRACGANGHGRCRSSGRPCSGAAGHPERLGTTTRHNGVRFCRTPNGGHRRRSGDT